MNHKTGLLEIVLRMRKKCKKVRYTLFFCRFAFRNIFQMSIFITKAY